MQATLGVLLAWHNASSVMVDIGVLVFREGLECILVLASVTASFRSTKTRYTRLVLAGVGVAILATLITWRVVARTLNDISESVSALAVQAGTGLLAIIVLLVVMNWFFHKLYWTGWISYHNERKAKLLRPEQEGNSKARVVYGMVLLGFTSFYREGFEVVLFLQSYRLRFGSTIVLLGVLFGVLASSIVVVLTFIAHQHLPYRKMLVATGMMLGFVLLVMVGEEAQEMQLAQWLTTTQISPLARLLPSSWGLWFSIFPTVETLSAQGVAGLLVVGSYFLARSEKS